MSTKRKAEYPHQIADIVAELLKEGDLEGIVNMFHPECEICMSLDGPAMKGHAGAREVFKDFAAMKATLINEVTGEKIIGDTALLQGKWSMEDTQGNVIAGGVSSEVAKRLNDGSWVYFIDCPIGAPSFDKIPI